jgi:hypothetical protein
VAQGFSPAFFAALKGLRHCSHIETALVRSGLWLVVLRVA